MRSATTMNLTACVGLKETLAANRSTTDERQNRYPMNEFIGKNFFDGDNYRAVLERLDEGYEVSMDLIELMQDFCDEEQDQARRWSAYTDKWIHRLKQQSSLVSYHSTKRAQLDLVRTTRDLIKLKEKTCVEMQRVIDKYRNYVEKIYQNERFRPGRRHHRTHEFKKSFKTAQAPLREINGEIRNVSNQIEKVRDAVRTAECACEILQFDPTVSEKQRARANDILQRKQTARADLEDRLVQLKEKQKSAEKTYRVKATEIFQQCQSLEEERLEQIRETLLDFLQAAHPTTYSNELTGIFQGLTEKITTQQNSFDDLLFWAKNYGIENKLTKSLPIDKDLADDDEQRRPNRSKTKPSSMVNQSGLSQV